MRILIIFCLLLSAPAVSSSEPVIINAVGDIMLAGSGTGLFNKTGYDYPFTATASVLRQGDITIGNLESPITRFGSEFKGKKFRFKSSPAAAVALRKAGFNHLSLANNHILDFGSDGLKETIANLDKLGITHAGAGPDLDSAREGSIISVKGVKIALLAYSLTYPAQFYAAKNRPGTAPGHENHYRADIARARKSADYVVVSFHWGTECADFPKDYQKRTAHKAIDAGADVVLGHHPHVVQGIEYYKNGVVFYSLGNFAFSSQSKIADKSMIARITLDNGISSVEVIPLNVLNSDVKYQPRLLTGIGGDALAKRLNRLSAEMGTLISPSNGRYLAEKRGREIAWQ